MVVVVVVVVVSRVVVVELVVGRPEAVDVGQAETVEVGPPPEGVTVEGVIVATAMGENPPPPRMRFSRNPNARTTIVRVPMSGKMGRYTRRDSTTSGWL